MKAYYQKQPVVIADPPDVNLALTYGKVRQDESQNRVDAHGLINDDEVVDLERQAVGLLGEMATACYFGIPYQFTVNTFKAPDVILPSGLGIQVKATERSSYLIIRPDAKDPEPYVSCLVTVHSPYELYGAIVKLRGWITPYQARLLADVDESMWRDPPENMNGALVKRNAPAIFVPLGYLSEMSTLEHVIRAKENNVGTH